jgi:hypothetical protein
MLYDQDTVELPSSGYVVDLTKDGLDVPVYQSKLDQVSLGAEFKPLGAPMQTTPTSPVQVRNNVFWSLLIFCSAGGIIGIIQ